VTAGSTAEVEHRIDLATGQIRCDQRDGVFGLSLVAMLVDVKVVLAEPLLEPVGLL